MFFVGPQRIFSIWLVFLGHRLRKNWTKLSVVVQLLSCIWLFATPWTAARQASLSFTISQSLLKLMSIESVMPSNHLVLYHLLLLLPSIFPSLRVFLMSQVFTSGGQSIGASASVLPMNTQGWFPLRWTGLISLLSTGHSRVFSSTTVWKLQFFGTQSILSVPFLVILRLCSHLFYSDTFSSFNKN